MIIESANTTETNLVDSQTFSIKQSPLMFDILSSKLYSNPIKAIVRELLTNAYDSHKVAKNTDAYIEVTIPKLEGDNLVIRDYGVGLSETAMMTLYTTFFDSTKNQDNELTGGFGLGSKTPFAYTDSFFVTSYYDGLQQDYVLFKNDGVPSINKIGEASTNKSRGLEITIPVHGSDIPRFAEELISFCTYSPEVNIEFINASVVDIPKPKVTIDKYSWFDKHALAGSGIKQGQNIFYISDIFNSLTESDKNLFTQPIENILKLFEDDVVTIEVPIGTLEVAPNREFLHLNKNTILKLVDIIGNYYKDIITYSDQLMPYNLLCVTTIKLHEKSEKYITFLTLNKEYAWRDNFSVVLKLDDTTTVNTRTIETSHCRETSVNINHYSSTMRVYNTALNVTIIPVNSEIMTSNNVAKIRKRITNNNSVILIQYTIGTDLNDVIEKTKNLLKAIEDSKYTDKLSIMSLEDFYEKYPVLTQTPDVKDSKKYRCGVYDIAHYGVSDTPNVSWRGGSLWSLAAINNTSLQNIKFKSLVAPNIDKEKQVDILRAYIGVDVTNTEENTFIKYINEELNTPVHTKNKVTILQLHKEAFEKSTLPEFDLKKYIEWTYTLGNQLPEYLKEYNKMLPNIPSVLKCIDIMFDKKPKDLIILRNTIEYKTLKACSKYVNISNYEFKHYIPLTDSRSYLVDNCFRHSFSSISNFYPGTVDMELGVLDMKENSYYKADRIKRLYRDCTKLINKYRGKHDTTIFN